MEREGAGWAREEMDAFGAIAGSAHVMELGRLANDNPPRLRSIDQKGRRLDKVEFHPAYHELMTLSFRTGCIRGRGRRSPPESSLSPARWCARAAQYYLITQAEAGHLCPITMTHAAFAQPQANDAARCRGSAEARQPGLRSIVPVDGGARPPSPSAWV